jgi:predicted Kef-type K+ transport protein
MTDFEVLRNLGAEVVVSLLLIIILAGVFVWAILRAAHFPPPTSLVVALSLLTFLALAGSIATQSTELVTLAATGIGSLAGSVSAQFTDPNRRTDEEDDDGRTERDTADPT